MSFKIEQAGRLLTLEFDGALSTSIVPLAFHGQEALSELYNYTVDVISDDMALDPKKVLGHDVTVIVTLGELKRRFTGIVTRFSPGLQWGRGYRAYQLEVVPKLWLATLNARCRSFDNKSALDIIESVLSEYGINSSTRGAGSTSRPVREYCLQYCESDYAFISRLLEEEGLFFYFPADHKNNSIVLVDGLNGSFEVTSKELDFGPHEAITAWSHDVRTVSKGVTFSGYDFKQAEVSAATVSATNVYSAGTNPVEFYPSNTMDTPRSQFFADMRMQFLERDYETYGGASAHPGFAPGGRFKLKENEILASSDTLMLSMVRHQATCYTQVSTDAAEADYSNSFGCVSLDTKFRPALRTPRPVIRGLQTAVVSSDPDEYGRVKVKFHWGDKVESFWARVAMPWAHKQMGMQFLPRINSEVVVDFLEGNPERPIVVGAVYNGVNKPIYTLPANKTQSGIRGTDPDKTGAAEALNELQFEDKSGEEFINFFAKKDFKRTVKNNDKLTVTQNRDVVIEQGNLSVKINTGQSSTEAAQSIELKVGSNSLKIDQQGISLNGMNIKIEGQVNTQVKGGAMTDVEASGQLTLKGAMTMIN
ncbi:MAG TPA: type VI secretion system tip protein TssI/VgrG [Stellaceae bacterium]|nr:type VI secretion system tip protein TssI/VgrG [Stellaceae bacterium]